MERMHILIRLVDVTIGGLVGFLLAWDIVFARSIDMAKAGVSLWVFLAVGAFIILLQGIPAFLLISGFIIERYSKKEE